MIIPRLMRRFGLRERIWLTVVAAFAVVLLALIGGFNLLVENRLSQDADNVAAARASAELDVLNVTRAGIVVADTADAGGLDTPTWVFNGNRAVEAPDLGRHAAALALALTARPRGYADLPAQDLRLYGLPVLSRGHRVGTVVAAVELGPYEEIRQIALLASSLLGLLAVVGVGVASRWIIARSLAPVATMTRQAAEWSDHDLDRRFGLGEPHDEFTTLATTLDDLLDRVAASLRHEQNLTAELSHELRTPLTQISTEAQYALRHVAATPEQEESFRRIIASARQMTRILETLMTAARSDAGGAHQTSCDAAVAAQAAIEPFLAVAAEAGVTLSAVPPPQALRIPFDAGVVERILAPLLENACRFAAHRITVAVARGDRTIDFTVADDGPGIAPEHVEDVFAPGFRASSATAGGVATVMSAGLGLPLSRRLARGLGGDVRALGGDAGARLVVSLPRE